MTIEWIWLLVEGVLLLGALIWLGIEIRELERQSEAMYHLTKAIYELRADTEELRKKYAELEARARNI